VRSLVALAAGGAALSLVVCSGPRAWAFTGADNFSTERFDQTSTQVTNRFLPMTAGTRYVFDGTVTEGDQTSHHRIVTTITGVTKLVDGVRARVVLDQDYDDGELSEQELALFAQDTAGVVWALGEYPEEFAGGEFSGAPSTWLAGRAGATAGVAMQAAPATGTPEYNQGFAPKIDFDDRGIVTAVGRHTSDALDGYDDAIVVTERSAPEPDDGHQLKFHAPGQGVVRIEAVGGKAQETLQRSAVSTLDTGELAQVNAQVLKLDGRAYQNASGVWTGSAPATGTTGGAEDGPGQSCQAVPAGRANLRGC